MIILESKYQNTPNMRTDLTTGILNGSIAYKRKSNTWNPWIDFRLLRISALPILPLSSQNLVQLNHTAFCSLNTAYTYSFSVFTYTLCETLFPNILHHATQLPLSLECLFYLLVSVKCTFLYTTPVFISISILAAND